MAKQFGSGIGAGEACTKAEKAATATEAMAMNLMLDMGFCFVALLD